MLCTWKGQCGDEFLEMAGALASDARGRGARGGRMSEQGDQERETVQMMKCIDLDGGIQSSGSHGCRARSITALIEWNAFG